MGPECEGEEHEGACAAHVPECHGNYTAPFNFGHNPLNIEPTIKQDSSDDSNSSKNKGVEIVHGVSVF